MKLYQIKKKKKKISLEHCYQLCIWLKWEFSLLYLLLLLLLFSLKTLLTYYWSNSSPRLFTPPPFFFFFLWQDNVWCFGWQNGGDQTKDGKDITLLGGAVYNYI